MAGRPGSPKPIRRRNTQRRKEAIAGYLFISPWIIGFLIFTVGAMVYSLVISFSYYNLATNQARPAGFDNYAQLFADPKVAVALKNTLFYAVLAVPLEICFALFLAMLLNQATRGAGIFRTLYYLPKMTPSVATASIFLLLLNGNTGAINEALGFFGIQGPQWLVDPNWVKPSIVLMTLWGVSGTMVIFLAALKNVPRDLYEVASLDGASPARQFFAITVPMISGAIFFNVIVLTIAALQVFDQAFSAVLAGSEQRFTGILAVLRRLPLYSGVPAIRLRLRLGDGLAIVRDHLDHQRHPGPRRQPVRLL